MLLWVSTFLCWVARAQHAFLEVGISKIFQCGAERAGWGKGGLMLLGPGVDELPSNHEQPEVSFNWASMLEAANAAVHEPVNPRP